MNIFTGYSNIFEINMHYKRIETQILCNPYDRGLYRHYIEYYKCTIGNDVRTLIENFDNSKQLKFLPTDEMFKSIKNIDEHSINAFKCICSFINDKKTWQNYCPYKRVYKKGLKNKPYRIKKYLREIVKDAKVALCKVVHNIKIEENKNDLEKYRIILFALKLILNTFYFSKMPKTLTSELYFSCLDKYELIKNHYTYRKISNSYILNSNSNLRKKRGVAISLNYDVAWIIAAEKINRAYVLSKVVLRGKM